MRLQAVNEDTMSSYFPSNKDKVEDVTISVPVKPGLYKRALKVREEISKDRNLKKVMGWGPFISGVLMKFLDEYEENR